MSKRGDQSIKIQAAPAKNRPAHSQANTMGAIDIKKVEGSQGPLCHNFIKMPFGLYRPILESVFVSGADAELATCNGEVKKAEPVRLCFLNCMSMVKKECLLPPACG